MAEYRYAVDSTTKEFVYGGYPLPYDVVPGLSPGQVRVVSSRRVNQRMERWNDSMDPDDCTRPATQAEIDAYDAAQATQAAEAQAGTNVMRALTRATFELKTNAWTLVQYRARIRQLLEQGGGG